MFFVSTSARQQYTVCNVADVSLYCNRNQRASANGGMWVCRCVCVVSSIVVLVVVSNLLYCSMRFDRDEQFQISPKAFLPQKLPYWRSVNLHQNTGKLFTILSADRLSASKWKGKELDAIIKYLSNQMSLCSRSSSSAETCAVCFFSFALELQG